MTAETNYFVHSFSAYIFQVKALPLQWFLQPVGIGVAALVAISGFLMLGVLVKKKPASANLFSQLQSFWLFLSIVFGALVALSKWNPEWGLRWYSTMYLLGFTYTYFACKFWMSRRKLMLTQEMLDSLIAFLILGMIIGARAFYVFVYNWNSYSQNLSDIGKVWEGGLSFHGGIVGVVIGILLYCRSQKVPFFHLADRLCLTVPFGIALGRMGNFMNGELYGRVIQGHVPWAMIFPDAGPQPRHPSQIYQSLGEGWCLFITLLIINKFSKKEGTVAASFVFFYGFYRIFMEFFREADEQLKYYFNNTTTMGQILCGVTMLIGIAVYFVFVRNNMIRGSAPWESRYSEFETRSRGE
jgi:phosphatidylglycerol---prolipoprotein diacylglyceryl transferase